MERARPGAEGPRVLRQLAGRPTQPRGDPHLTARPPRDGGRDRVRRHLAGRAVDRPPFIAFATTFAARLEQVDARDLWHDAGLLTRALTGLQRLFGLDAVVIDVPADELLDGDGPVVAAALERLRALLGEEAAVVLALPGPLTLCAARGAEPPADDELEQTAQRVLAALGELGPQHADAIAVVERVAVGARQAEALDDALAPIWNAARYYAVPSMLVAGRATVELGEAGSDAVVAWAGVEPRELARHGARRVGVPIAGGASPSELPALVPGGFYTTVGELPADTDIEWLHQLVGAGR